jgi:phospholipase C
VTGVHEADDASWTTAALQRGGHLRVPGVEVAPALGAGPPECPAIASVLRFIETRFGTATPNLSAWRRGITGDFTGALNLTVPANTSFPSNLPPVSLGDTETAEQAVLNALAGTLAVGIPYPLPTANSMPVQESSPARPQVP